ncbi:MAG: methyltransferase domain-containing protein [SAR202 cluster bacterium]|nr:methyltransferase domain-containing protein [SAR202 cluster bacterium]
MGGYGIFGEEIQKITNQDVIIIEPAPHLAEVCRNKGFKVVEKFLEDVSVIDMSEKPKCFVSFELFEHLYSPEVFLTNLNKLMKPNELFVFTTLSGRGLDIQVLWENSPSVSPPHHLNFFNPYSVKILLEKTGYHCIDVTTPGKLDIDILVNNKENVKDRFWKTFLKTADESQKQNWQDTITKTGWSSHMMVVCQK